VTICEVSIHTNTHIHILRDEIVRGPSTVALDVTFVGAQHVYGIPEHASTFALKNTNGDAYSDPYRLFNLDVFEYELDEPMALYGAVPYVSSISDNGSPGVLWLNAAETFVDVSDASDGSTGLFSTGPKPSKNTHWISEAGSFSVFLIPAHTPEVRVV
jgi:alpha 1,3-glucosidase